MSMIRKPFLLFVVAALLESTTAPPVNSTESIVPVKISIPDSNEVVKTDVPSHSAIPECLRSSPGVANDGDVLLVLASVFTDCARKELARLQNEIQPDASRPVSQEDTQTDVGEGNAEGNSTQEPPEKLPHDGNEEEETPEHDEETKLTSKSATAKKVSDSPPAVPDLTSVTNAFDSVKPISKNPGVLGEVVRILQVIFDYKRIQSDLQRILNGDLHKVLQEYPNRAAGFFKLIVELPERFKGAAQDVDKIKQQSKIDSPHYDVFDKLHSYMDAASRTSQELPNMLSLVSTVDTLRNIASRIGANPSPVQALQPLPMSEPAVLLREITSAFQVIPNVFGNILGRRHDAPQYVPQNPVAKQSRPAGTAEAKSVDASATMYQDLATVSLRAVDAVSKTLFGILARDIEQAEREGQDTRGTTKGTTNGTTA